MQKNPVLHIEKLYNSIDRDLKNLSSQIDLIKYPIITEKSNNLFEENKYTFIVDKRINKKLIKKTIDYLFKVKVVKVNTCRLPKKKKEGRMSSGYKPLYKKAIVRLKEGYTIDLFRGN
uniref:ribosomal protein L23 n=1 Tax=Haramonas pauciplastida TaxID=478668 RepID=UPI002113FD8C|nr:ribosomal protein L23 [Haramonas pauciplastida]UTE94979.1 ribosomal protein L23 [Haramonas pauciplastida]